MVIITSYRSDGMLCSLVKRYTLCDGQLVSGSNTGHVISGMESSWLTGLGSFIQARRLSRDTTYTSSSVERYFRKLSEVHGVSMVMVVVVKVRDDREIVNSSIVV